MQSDIGILDRKLDRVFAMLDADGDGQVVEADVVGLADRLGSAFGADAVGGKIDRLRDALHIIWKSDLTGMDADGNGYLDPQEFRDGMRSAYASDPSGFMDRFAEMVAAWMNVCDTDGNGVIDLEEFTRMYTCTLGADPEALQYAFRQLDLDGNGVLDAEEIRQATHEYYTSEDPQARGNWLFGPI